MTEQERLQAKIDSIGASDRKRQREDELYHINQERMRNATPEKEKEVIHLPGNGVIEVDRVETWPETGRLYEGAMILIAPKTLGVDMKKAREIQRDLIRQERELLWPELDLEIIRAHEETDGRKRNPVVNDIAARKQALRDAPASESIDNATTDIELAAITAQSFIDALNE